MSVLYSPNVYSYSNHQMIVFAAITSSELLMKTQQKKKKKVINTDRKVVILHFESQFGIYYAKTNVTLSYFKNTHIINLLHVSQVLLQEDSHQKAVI